MRRILMLVPLIAMSCQTHPPVGSLWMERPSFVLPVQDLNDGKLWVFFVETTKGQGVLVKSPDNKYVIIDTGPENQSHRMAELLYRLRVSEVDAVFLSHPDDHHVEGMVSLSKDLGIRIQNLYHNGTMVETGRQEWAYIRDSVKGQVLAVQRRHAPIAVGALTFTVLNPRQPPYVQTDDDVDNNGLVLRMDCGGHSFLFTSDIHVAAERDLVEDPEMKKLLDVDVLQVGSHGREVSTSDDFAKAVTPRLAVIQGVTDNPAATGRRPGQEVADETQRSKIGQVAPLVERALKGSGEVQIVRTDEKGTIAVISDGSTLHYRTSKDSINATNHFPVK